MTFLMRPRRLALAVLRCGRAVLVRPGRPLATPPLEPADHLVQPEDVEVAGAGIGGIGQILGAAAVDADQRDPLAQPAHLLQQGREAAIAEQKDRQIQQPRVRAWRIAATVSAMQRGRPGRGLIASSPRAVAIGQVEHLRGRGGAPPADWRERRAGAGSAPDRGHRGRAAGWRSKAAHDVDRPR